MVPIESAPQIGAVLKDGGVMAFEVAPDLPPQGLLPSAASLPDNLRAGQGMHLRELAVAVPARESRSRARAWRSLCSGDLLARCGSSTVRLSRAKIGLETSTGCGCGIVFKLTHHKIVLKSM
jgi:hypothetical protein